jgi:hypothetical protein
MSAKIKIWTESDCIQQCVLRLHEHPDRTSSDPEKIQDEIIDMPFNKRIIELALKQLEMYQLDETSTIFTYRECIEQVKAMLNYNLPKNYNSQKCHVQRDFNLPFRKGVVKMALYELYAAKKLLIDNSK